MKLLVNHMKNFNEFINEDHGMGDKYGDMETWRALDKLCEYFVKDWNDKFKEEEALIDSNIEVFKPGQGAIGGAAKDLEKGRIEFRIISNTPPADLDELEEFITALRSVVKETRWFKIQYIDDELLIDAVIQLKNIDKNILKSYLGINKFGL